MSKHVCVIGATGVAGSAFLEYCLGDKAARTTSGWSFYGVSRQAAPPALESTEAEARSYTHVQADLLSDFTELKNLRSITHVVFAGFVPAAGFDKQVLPNKRMLENCLQALSSCPLEQVVLIQGMKYYGSHLGAFKTPAREDDARHPGPNYYYEQQDLLQASGIDWTCLRPHVICGTSSFGTTQNILAVLGVYASLSKAENKVLDWPGSEASFNSLNQATDARLLAEAITWSLHSPEVRNQAFNITNGDFFRWQHLWPRVAEVFDIQVGAVNSQELATTMPQKEALWDKLAAQHHLQTNSLKALVDWQFADYILNTGWDVMASTTKVRTYGFPAFTDTEDMYIDLLQEMRSRKIVP